MKPDIIYVSGAPGSGKTTLARLLSDELYIPHVSSDLVQGGIELTQPDHDRKTAIASAFIPLMIDMAQKQISFVVDHVLQKDTAKSTIIDKLTPYAHIIYVHVHTSDPIGRYISRIEASELPDIIRRRELLLERAKYHRENLVNTAEVIELDIPTIVVNADDGYDPDLRDVLEFIRKRKK
jgi:adenylate kinase family enzyme